MRILIADGERRFLPTGYGALSRSISLALHLYSEHDVFFEVTDKDFVHDVPDMDTISTIGIADQRDVDMILRIGRPGKPIVQRRPCLVYTQNALGELPPNWIENLAGADGIVVPGEFDRRVFARHFENVFVCPQHVDERQFKSVPRWRAEGPDAFSFLFVGSYSYRKGVDLLPAAFARAFADGAPVNLHMHCFSGFQKTKMTHFFEVFRTLPSNVTVSCFSGEVSAEWMKRYYNRHDAVVTFSRGEGWCMPLHEALLCGKPVIAPDSTAMGEALPANGVRRVSVNETSIPDLKDPFAESMVRTYGQPGNHCWEVDIDDAAKALREVYDDRATYAKAAVRGREFVVEQYSLQRMATDLNTAIHSMMERIGA